MTVNTLYSIITYAAAKNIQLGYVSPDDFNLSVNNAQNMYLAELLGEYQQYKANRPISVVQFGNNERVRQSINPLIYGTVLSIDNFGKSSFPYDFEYTDSMWSLYGFNNIRFVQQDRLDSFLHSEIDPIDDNPVYLINHEGFLFFPNDLPSARLSYVRTPPTIRWAYTPDGNGLPVYDPSNSIDPVWGESDMMEIIVRALRLIGCNLQLGAVVQYSQEVKNTGQ